MVCSGSTTSNKSNTRSKSMNEFVRFIENDFETPHALDTMVDAIK